jgi:integrase/recombinase XerD
MAKPLMPNKARKVISQLEKLSPDPDYLLIETLIRTGMRTEELIRLRPSQIDAETGTISVKAVKRGLNHETPVTKEFARRLLRHLEAHGSALGHWSGAQLLSSKKARLRQLWAVRRRSLGLDGYGLHSLRGAFAMLILDRTQDVMLVRHMLGHKSIQSTMHYLHLVSIEGRRGDVLRAVG